MRLIFLHGPPAAGKLTIGRLVSARTGLPLFHNHLIVDAVAAVFPFGSPEFVRLRERFWIETIDAAARIGQSLIFTFAPEPSVAEDFPARVADIVAGCGGEVIYVALDVSTDAQEQRVANEARAEFGKLRSLELLCTLGPVMAVCAAAMPTSALRLDTTTITPNEAADAIVRLLER